MRDRHRIVDNNEHTMQSEWRWERHIAAEFDERTSPMGEAPDSGRRTSLPLLRSRISVGLNT